MNLHKQIIVSGAFDDIRARDLRLLHEASKLGEVTVLIWSDELIDRLSGKPPKFSLAERQYFLNAVRFVNRVEVAVDDFNPETLPQIASLKPDVWAMRDSEVGAERKLFCQKAGVQLRGFLADELAGFPELPSMLSAAGRKKIIVTGCYDWFHSGHVRFTEEVSVHGDLYVVVGHDENIRLLKGEGHPLIGQAERRYVVGSIRFVKQALISTGNGWLDAEPEIKRIKPDIYAVNEDGDKGGKREYCKKNGIEYLVLKRTPAPGLPKRSSTDLRGF
jgi:cytidyltransferase-like protein